MSCVVLELALLIKGEAIVRLDWVLVFVLYGYQQVKYVSCSVVSVISRLVGQY